MAKSATKRPAPPAITLGSIQTIVTATTPKKTGSREIPMDDIANIAAIDRVISDLETAKAIVDERIRAAAKKRFLDEGCAAKARPTNFKGTETETIDGITVEHSAGIELRNSGKDLGDEAKALAEQHSIPTFTKVVTHGTYIVNPEFAGNMDVMQIVVDALNDAIANKGLPANILMLQEGTSKTVTTDETLPAIFKLPRTTAELLLPVFSTLAVGKFKYDTVPGKEDDLTPAILRTATLINRPGFRGEMEQTAQRIADEKKRTRKAA